MIMQCRRDKRNSRTEAKRELYKQLNDEFVFVFHLRLILIIDFLQYSLQVVPLGLAAASSYQLILLKSSFYSTNF